MILVRRAGSIASNVHARRMFQISVQSPVCLQSCVPYACVRSHAQMLEIVKCKHIVSISRFLHSAFICCNYARTLATTAACCKAGDATGARIRAHVVIECDKWLPGGAGAQAMWTLQPFSIGCPLTYVCLRSKVVHKTPDMVQSISVMSMWI